VVVVAVATQQQAAQVEQAVVEQVALLLVLAHLLELLAQPIVAVVVVELRYVAHLRAQQVEQAALEYLYSVILLRSQLQSVQV
jgi:hypothetical protein